MGEQPLLAGILNVALLLAAVASLGYYVRYAEGIGWAELRRYWYRFQLMRVLSSRTRCLLFLAVLTYMLLAAVAEPTGFSLHTFLSDAAGLAVIYGLVRVLEFLTVHFSRRIAGLAGILQMRGAMAAHAAIAIVSSLFVFFPIGTSSYWLGLCASAASLVLAFRGMFLSLIQRPDTIRIRARDALRLRIEVAALWLFFLLYSLGVAGSALVRLQPHAFATRSGATPTALEMFYFVIVTFTTTGYGDITAVSTAGRLLALVTMLSGYFYSILFIGNLLAVYSQPPKSGGPGPGATS